jgi:hypothetical protein
MTSLPMCLCDGKVIKWDSEVNYHNGRLNGHLCFGNDSEI